MSVSQAIVISDDDDDEKPETDVVLQYESVTIRKADLERLGDRQFLNDSLIGKERIFLLKKQQQCFFLCWDFFLK